MFSAKPQEIPLSNKTERRHISVVVGILVFLLSVLFIAATNIGGAFFSIKADHQLTIEIPVEKLTYTKTKRVEVKNLETGEVQESKVEEEITPTSEDLYIQVTDFLKKDPTVVKYEKISPDIIKKNLQKWFTTDADLQKLPIYIDVDFASKSKIDAKKFQNGLINIHEKISIHFSERWISMLVLLSHVLKVVSVLFMGLITFCIVVLVTIITRSSLKTHFSIIEVLKYMGAKDSYIVNIYQKHVFSSVFTGGIFGVFMSIPVIYLFFMACSYFGINTPSFHLLAYDNIKVLISLPFFVTLIGILTTRIVVYRSLKEIN